MNVIADPREVVSSRIYEVSREELFDAWTNPERLARWWGPKGFTNTFHECEVSPGGTWRFTMRSPNGEELRSRCVFGEIVRPERIVLTHLEPIHRFELRADFEALGERQTRLVFHKRFATFQECERVRPVVKQGNEQSLERLAAEVALK